ncbi:hypothetical protein I4U23_004595 [Adineta vaga]|nr:hypothetical protein I4U23_004595 [Adineta vaga]
MSLIYLGQQIAIYGDITTFIIGVIGQTLNIIVFCSLRTFRQSSCAFYLTTMSFVNIGQLFFGLISRIMITGFAVDWSTMSMTFCKLRQTIFVFCSIMSYTCLCLAMIDQYFATSTHRRWQQWSHIRIAHYLMIFFTIIWSLHMILYIFSTDYVISSVTGKAACIVTKHYIANYRYYFVALCITGYLPVTLTVFFGILAYQNIQQIAYRTIPLVRRETDKQLTTMVFTQVLINVVTNVPFITLTAVSTTLNNSATNTTVLQRMQFAYIVTTILFYTYFSISFYIYICVSERFRRQFFYVLCHLHRKQCRKQQQVVHNQIFPIQSQSK